MYAYKGFEPDLSCRGYRFVMGKNVTPEANCASNGFHCAENPLDCLSYCSKREILFSFQLPPFKNNLENKKRGTAYVSRIS